MSLPDDDSSTRCLFSNPPKSKKRGEGIYIYFTIDSYPDIASESTWADFFNMATSSIQLYPKRYKAHSYSIIRMNMAPYLPNLFCWASVFILHLVKPRNKTTHQTHTHPPPPPRVDGKNVKYCHHFSINFPKNHVKLRPSITQPLRHQPDHETTVLFQQLFTETIFFPLNLRKSWIKQQKTILLERVYQHRVCAKNCLIFWLCSFFLHFFMSPQPS